MTNTLIKLKLNAHKIIIMALIACSISCSSTRNMQVLTNRPAPITVSRAIKNIVIVNASKGGMVSILEGVLTGELPGNDAALSRECLAGLNGTLNRSNRFVITINPKPLEARSDNTTSFGSYLDWKVLQTIASQYNAEAVLSLEYYDSDFIVSDVTKTVSKNDRVIVNNSGQALFYAGGTATARAGFRLYDVKNKKVIAENSYRSNRAWRESANTYLEAAAKLLKRNDALITISKQLGNAFANQLIPLSSWEARMMYKDKDDYFTKAERYALTNDWEKASTMWEEIFKKTIDTKLKAKCAYNLALANEILGNLSDAKTWIGLSYAENGNSNALTYSELLDNLIIDTEKLKQQLIDNSK